MAETKVYNTCFQIKIQINIRDPVHENEFIVLRGCYNFQITSFLKGFHSFPDIILVQVQSHLRQSKYNQTMFILCVYIIKNIVV